MEFKHVRHMFRNKLPSMIVKIETNITEGKKKLREVSIHERKKYVPVTSVEQERC
jgi:hypothetical protein